jgi:hypothetical protein
VVGLFWKGDAASIPRKRIPFFPDYTGDPARSKSILWSTMQAKNTAMSAGILKISNNYLNNGMPPERCAE